MADGPEVLGVIELKDVVKQGIREKFDEMRAIGIRTVMITGDNPLTAAAIAQEAGVDDFLAEATPEAKMALIKAEQEGGKLVAMTGDGTNDAPALAQADVGVAMNTGTTAAKEAGNMVDLDSNPTKLIDIVEIGKQLLITRGSLTTFSIANDVAKYFAIIPALFAATYPQLNTLNIMKLHSPESAVLSAVIFNALVIVALIPLALRGVRFRAAVVGRHPAPQHLHLRHRRDHRPVRLHQADRPDPRRSPRVLMRDPMLAHPPPPVAGPRRAPDRLHLRLRPLGDRRVPAVLPAARPTGPSPRTARRSSDRTGPRTPGSSGRGSTAAPTTPAPTRRSKKNHIAGGDNPLEANGISRGVGRHQPRPTVQDAGGRHQGARRYWHARGVNPTPDLVTTSGSGYDPDISPQDAIVQIPMVSQGDGDTPIPAPDPDLAADPGPGAGLPRLPVHRRARAERSAGQVEVTALRLDGSGAHGLPLALSVAAAIPRSRVAVSGVIVSAKLWSHGRSGGADLGFRCVLDDGTGRIDLVFLGRVRVPGLVVGARCHIEGTARMEHGHLTVWNPLYRLAPSGSPEKPGGPDG